MKRKSKATEKEAKVTKVPKKFIKHILNLGFDEKDAPLLYENKDDWVGVELDSMVKCTAHGCQFKTKLAVNCLVDHCSKKHGWRDYPCKYDNCTWVSYSSFSDKGNVQVQFYCK